MKSTYLFLKLTGTTVPQPYERGRVITRNIFWLQRRLLNYHLGIFMEFDIMEQQAAAIHYCGTFIRKAFDAVFFSQMSQKNHQDSNPEVKGLDTISISTILRLYFFLAKMLPRLVLYILQIVSFKSPVSKLRLVPPTRNSGPMHQSTRRKLEVPGLVWSGKVFK